ncbi:hypothetical protein BH20ACT2_BH20ACT2_16750 [soil metagenome]
MARPDADPDQDLPDGDLSRTARFRRAARKLRVGAGAVNWDERQLMVIGGVLAPAGLALVLLGWFGASRTPNLYEQIPYMISGGLLGLALVFLGATCYFAHWLTQMVKENRTHTAAMVAAIKELQEHVGSGAAVPAAGEPATGERPPGNGAARPVGLVATAKGSMVHRPDCVIVAGKRQVGLRQVDDTEGLIPCKLCDPYAVDEPAESSWSG